MPEFIRLLNNHRKFGKMMFDRTVTENDALRPQQVFLLDDLREVGKSKLKDIAAKTGHSPQNLCMLYAKLEKAGRSDAKSTLKTAATLIILSPPPAKRRLTRINPAENPSCGICCRFCPTLIWKNWRKA